MGPQLKPETVTKDFKGSYTRVLKSLALDVGPRYFMWKNKIKIKKQRFFIVS